MLLLMSPNLPEEFQTLVLSREKTVQFYTLCPIYPEEMHLKMDQGADILLDRFDEYGITDIVDLDRPNVALA